MSLQPSAEKKAKQTLLHVGGQSIISSYISKLPSKQLKYDVHCKDRTPTIDATLQEPMPNDGVLQESNVFACNESAENATPNSDPIPAANTNILGIPINITETGKREDNKRTFQNKWLVDRGWLRYDGLCHVCWCEPCCWAFSLKRFPSFIKITEVERSPFVKGGFHSWRKGKEKISQHEDSLMHKEAMKIFLAHQNRKSVEVVLQRKRNEEMGSNRDSLGCIFEAIFYLARQGKALRGHTDDESNLKQLLQLIGKYNDNMKQWLNKTASWSCKYKWTSPQIQNEILEMLHHSILRKIITKVKESTFFAIIIDETTDLSVSEQVSICVRYVTKEFDIEEDFLGFAITHRTDAETLQQLVQNVLLQSGLDFYNIRGQAYDGAANMRGKDSGLQARILQENNKALFVYCVGHQLNLVCQDATKALPSVVRAMGMIQAIINFVRNSAKRLNSFEKLVAQEPSLEGQLHLRPLCQTRWVLRLPALEAFVNMYSLMLDWFEDMSHDQDQDTNTRSIALGHLQNMESFEMFFLVKTLHRLFSVIHPVHTAVQGRNVAIGHTRRNIEHLAMVLSLDAGNDERAIAFYQATREKAIEMRIDLPTLPRGHAEFVVGETMLPSRYKRRRFHPIT